MQYKISGGNLPVAICRLAAGESIKCESGGMSWMDNTIEMQTKGGGFGKMMGRMVSGESMFFNHYVARSEGEIAFASSFPGEIKAIQISAGNSLIAQKGAFLACQESVDMKVFFQRKLGSGFFGGEGFIMQRYSGEGLVFIEIDGSALTYDLAPGETKVVDTGYLVAMEESVKMDIVRVKGVKNVLLGGEGLFNTTLTGPGKIVLQTMPIAKTAAVMRRYAPTSK